MLTRSRRCAAASCRRRFSGVRRVSPFSCDGVGAPHGLTVRTRADRSPRPHARQGGSRSGGTARMPSLLRHEPIEGGRKCRLNGRTNHAGPTCSRSVRSGRSGSTAAGPACGRASASREHDAEHADVVGPLRKRPAEGGRQGHRLPGPADAVQRQLRRLSEDQADRQPVRHRLRRRALGAEVPPGRAHGVVRPLEPARLEAALLDRAGASRSGRTARTTWATRSRGRRSRSTTTRSTSR